MPVCMATPVPPCNVARLTSSDIIAIAPEAPSCAEAPLPSECATATNAAPWIDMAFHTLNIHAFGTQAALLSLMLHESGSFKYNVNHYLGVLGRDTRSMQSPAFNLKYARWLAANVTDSGISVHQVEDAEKEEPVQVLAFVNGDRWYFASAARFLATQSDEVIIQMLAAATEEGWNTSMTECVVWGKVIASEKW
ncbi:hypothetical protein E4T39_01032 [Aureobasidium subglaciale]|nr:hypothetical protein E4T39_01032 [Aureobasidium subglaciale]